MKKIILVLLFMCMSVVQLSAEEIQMYDDSLYYFSEGESVCANQPYYIDNPVQYQEVVIKDADTNVILEVYNVNSATVELIFPENAGNVDIVVTNYNANGKLDPATEHSMNVVVESCGYSVVKPDYSAKVPYATFELKDNIITVTPPSDVTDYMITYKFVGQEAGREHNDSESFTIDLKENTVLQFTESYTNSDGAAVTNYYELEVNPATNDYFIRNVDSFNIDTIDIKSLINVKLLLILLIILFLLMFFMYKHKRLKRKIKKRRESRR